jgi:hypothetical protein
VLLKKPMTAKRNLRVLKWIGMVPAVGRCTLCDREFTVTVSDLKRVTDAQQSLTAKFAEHHCEQKVMPN